MNLTELLAELSLKGVELWSDGDRLRCRAPQGILTERLRADLALHKTEILALLEEARGSLGERSPITPVRRDQPIPLSLAQEEIFLSDQFMSGRARSLDSAFRLAGPLDVPVLERSLQEVIARHEPLRTAITWNGVDAFQVAAPHLDLPVPILDLRHVPEEQRDQALLDAAAGEAGRPFDLARGPLIRTALFRLEDRQHILFVSAHHIVFDVWSAWIFIRELAALYEAFSAGKPSPLRPLSVQYADFAVWQRHQLQSGDPAREAGIAYWKRRLAGAPVLLELPTDRPRGPIDGSRNARFPFGIPEAPAERLRSLSQRSGTTMFMTLLAALQTLLCRYSGQEDILVGSPVSGRIRPEMELMIGSFAYPIVFRTDLSGDPTFTELLARVRETTMESYRHQDVPFGKVMEVAAPKRNSTHTPIFQVMFTFPPPPSSIQAGGLTVSAAEELYAARVDYDLFLGMMDGPGGLSGMLTYNPGLFEVETVQRMIGDFRALIETIGEKPDQRLSRLLPPDLIEYRRRRALIDGHEVDLTELEAALLADTSIEDARVLARHDESGAAQLVAYVVAAGSPSLEAFRSRLAERFPTSSQPNAWVPIASLPLRPNGRVDDDALAQLPVIEDDLRRRCEESLRAVPGVDSVAVVVEDHTPQDRPLHISDLIPGWIPAVRGLDKTPADCMAEPAGNGSSRPLAFADGGPLIIPRDSPRTLTDALLRTAETRPRSGLTCIDANDAASWRSYASLVVEARRILSGLRERGMKPKDRVILQIESLSDYFAAFWACVLGGITPVTVAIAPSYDEKNAIVNKIANTWELLGRPPIITSASLLERLSVLETLIPMPGLTLLPVEHLKDHDAAESLYESRPDDLVFFQLTSGSTGVPKCIQETHRGIISHIHGSQLFNGYTADDVCLNWLPLDHVVPLLTIHLKDVYLGCREIQVESKRILSDPLRWLDLIEAHRVTHTWAPNFAFKMVAESLARSRGRRWDLSSIRRFMNAGEQVTLPIVREFLVAVAPFGVPEQAMQPAFGMAEVCTTMTYQNEFCVDQGARWFLRSSLGGALRTTRGDDEAAIGFVDLGPPIPGVQIRIAGAENNVLPEGTIGRLQIRGDSVTPGYVQNEAANHEAFAGDGWFNSGDLGFILDGRLTLTGREKEMIIVRGANFYCYEIEDVVNGIDGVEPGFSAACAVEDAGAGTEALAIFFVPRSGVGAIEALVPLIREIRARITSSLGISPATVIPLARRDFPKTTSGKIQRSQLKKALAQGRYQPVQKEIDIALETSATLPDWFYRPVWVRKERLASRAYSGSGACLILSDPREGGQHLAEQLEGDGSPCVRVEPDTEFVRLAHNHYRIAPGDAGHYRELLRALEQDGLLPDRILHLWTFASSDREGIGLGSWEHSVELGACSLIFLAQALAELGKNERHYRLLVVSSQAQQVSPGEPVVCERALIPALVRTLAVELPWLHCSHIDVPSDAVETALTEVLRELGHKDREVALRDGKRMVPRLEKVNWSREERMQLPFRPGGMYVVSGGLGGIGAALAKLLLRRFGCRLLLLGRTPLETGMASDREDTHLREFQSLGKCGGEVRYEAVDIADPALVRQALERAQAAWGCGLDGVLHLAGSLNEQFLLEETRESFIAALRAKALGARSLHELVKDRPDALFVSFSSVNGFFGGLRAGAYSAASRFLEAFAGYQRAQGLSRSYCFSWSLWDEVGMSRGYPARELVESRGFRAIQVERGLLSLMAGLHQRDPRLVIGLDGTRRLVRLHTQTRELATTKLSGFFTTSGPETLLEPSTSLDLRDRFKSPVSCELLRVAALPVTASGEIELTALRVLERRMGGRSARVAPRTEMERTLAPLWRDLLGLAEVGVHDNFFDLGGHSMLLFQLHSRIRQEAGRELEMLDLIRYPTIASLAERLTRPEPDETPLGRGHGRAEIRRGALGRLEQLRQTRIQGRA